MFFIFAILKKNFYFILFFNFLVSDIVLGDENQEQENNNEQQEAQEFQENQNANENEDQEANEENAEEGNQFNYFPNKSFFFNKIKKRKNFN